MNRQGWWLAAIAGTVLLAVWIGSDPGAVSSTLSPDSRGWLAARSYLEARGTRVALHDEPLTTLADDTATSTVLVLTLPWQRAPSQEDLIAVGRFLRNGGTVVCAYSGELDDFRESEVLQTLSSSSGALRDTPPLAPVAWWRHYRERWILEPTSVWPDGPTLEIDALAAAPDAPRSARVFYETPDGRAIVFDYPLHAGRVLMLPAPLLANAWLTEAGNVDFLESLRLWLGEHWTFDEYHHGLVAPEAVTESTSSFAWDLFIAHLGLIYLLGFVALVRRFGPAWHEPPVTLGSTASFLRGLGSIHGKLKHHRDAAVLLIDRARTYEPRLAFDESLEEEARNVDSANDLQELARQVARVQRRR